MIEINPAKVCKYHLNQNHFRIDIQIKPPKLYEEYSDVDDEKMDNAKETNSSVDLERQLEAGVLLAAKYKSAALELERKLNESQRFGEDSVYLFA